MMNDFLYLLGRSSLHAGVLAGIVCLVLTLCGRWIAPKWRCIIWWVVAVRLLLPFSPVSHFSVFNSFLRADNFRTQLLSTDAPQSSQSLMPEQPIALQFTPGVEQDAMVELAWNLPVPFLSNQHKSDSKIFSSTTALVSIWAIGAFLLLLRTVMTTWRQHRAFRMLSDINSMEALKLLEECKTKFGISRGVRLMQGQMVKAPAVWGGANPAILLPCNFIAQFSLAEQRQVLLHELAHLKRRDTQTNWILCLLQIIHWFNPMIWFAFKWFRADREMACDELVLQVENDAEGYGRLLLRLAADVMHAATPQMIGISDPSSLRKRVETIAFYSFHRRPGWLASALLLLFILVGLTDAQEITNSGLKSQRSALPIQTKTTNPVLTGSHTDREFYARGHVKCSSPPHFGVERGFLLRDFEVKSADSGWEIVVTDPAKKSPAVRVISSTDKVFILTDYNGITFTQPPPPGYENTKNHIRKNCSIYPAGSIPASQGNGIFEVWLAFLSSKYFDAQFSAKAPSFMSASFGVLDPKSIPLGALIKRKTYADGWLPSDITFSNDGSNSNRGLNNEIQTYPYPPPYDKGFVCARYSVSEWLPNGSRPFPGRFTLELFGPARNGKYRTEVIQTLETTLTTEFAEMGSGNPPAKQPIIAPDFTENVLVRDYTITTPLGGPIQYTTDREFKNRQSPDFYDIMESSIALEKAQLRLRNEKTTRN